MRTIQEITDKLNYCKNNRSSENDTGVIVLSWAISSDENTIKKTLDGYKHGIINATVGAAIKFLDWVLEEPEEKKEINVQECLTTITELIHEKNRVDKELKEKETEVETEKKSEQVIKDTDEDAPKKAGTKKTNTVKKTDTAKSKAKKSETTKKKTQTKK